MDQKDFEVRLSNSVVRGANYPRFAFIHGWEAHFSINDVSNRIPRCINFGNIGKMNRTPKWKYLASLNGVKKIRLKER